MSHGLWTQTAVVDVVANVPQRNFHTSITASTGAVPSPLPSSSNFTSPILTYSSKRISLALSIARYTSSLASVQHRPPTETPPRHMFALWDILETKTGVGFARIRYKQVSTSLLCLWFAFFWSVDYPTSPSSSGTYTPSSPIPLPIPLKQTTQSSPLPSLCIIYELQSWFYP